MEDANKKEIIGLFSNYDFIIKDIDINNDELIANMYIVISDTDLYRIDSIEKMVNKIKSMKEELIKDGLVEDIMFGDLNKGLWRILVYFKKDE